MLYYFARVKIVIPNGSTDNVERSSSTCQWKDRCQIAQREPVDKQRISLLWTQPALSSNFVLLTSFTATQRLCVAPVFTAAGLEGREPELERGDKRLTNPSGTCC
ncbi:hypothetical protein RRG08_017463 [Elysia crispata]|uniref:Uncharacterized protein n=1 Tax=Elysia crispata TaxID=231223 RepID=A0AAE0YJP3_9GAST|nr:hypothetical protein RRG08_017463 [Elysia crispata]